MHTPSRKGYCCSQIAGLPARPNRPAARTELTAILLDERSVAALFAHLADDGFDGGGFDLAFGDL